jgi:hypothetical protein
MTLAAEHMSLMQQRRRLWSLAAREGQSLAEAASQGHSRAKPPVDCEMAWLGERMTMDIDTCSSSPRAHARREPQAVQTRVLGQEANRALRVQASVEERTPAEALFVRLDMRRAMRPG